ncbi:MAG: hypothetical protein OYL92_08410 [Acidobacteriota bacterium]|nr:hypothetical protein [Acidobacteriota bacterium]MDE3264984.1 hypothetical protein [Acidobacteriota bacterium]
MNRRKSLVAALIVVPTVWLAAAGCAVSGGSEAEAATDVSDFDASVDVGSIHFPTSAGEEAQKHFIRGVAILHSFGYEQAREQFHAAQELEPEFALAYWGETLTYNHPLLPERDLESPRDALERLGATREERAAKAGDERERGFLAAVEDLFDEGELAERRIAYMEAMERLYDRYPDDDEVAAFYALSLLQAVGPLGDDSFRLNVLAGSIALGVFERNPVHPGAAHYIIHAFDDPVHAPLALPAAYRFADIAAAVSHARHMPSHIFIQRGMWDRVSQSNDSAYEAAVALWDPGERVGDMVHSLDWGQYGDLQRGDYAKAREWIAELDDLVERTGDEGRGKSTVPLVRARYIVETEEWETREITDDTPSSELLATGISAVHTGELDLAREAAARLRKAGERQSGDSSTFQRGPKPAQVMHHEVAGLVRLAEGDADGAVEMFDKGLAIASTMGPPRGAASPIKPIRELYGEVLLQLERPEDAIAQFEDQLLYTPNRPRTLLGLARAQSAAGNRAAASEAYQRLLEMWSGTTEPKELAEAREFVAASA